MKILVCGGRDFRAMEFLDKTLDELQDELSPDKIEVLIHGCANGADTLAEKWAIRHGIPTVGCAADWATHGKAAGPIRNQYMLSAGKPDLVIAFPGGAGTRNMVQQARKAGVEVRVIKA